MVFIVIDFYVNYIKVYFTLHNFTFIYADEVRYLAVQAVSYLTNSLITLTSTGQFVSDVVSLQDYTFTILNNLSLTFRTNQEKLKFDLLDFFVKIFSYMTDQVFTIFSFNCSFKELFKYFYILNNMNLLNIV